MVINLNVGCGKDYRKSDKWVKWINVDIDNSVKCDIVCRVGEQKLPLEDNSVDFIRCIHVVEHLDNIIPFMNECHRVLKPGGDMIIMTPMPTTEYYWQDPTHKHGFVENTFKIYFVDNPWVPDTYGIVKWSKAETNVQKLTVNGYHADILDVKITK